jgi:hypothetical protein
MLSWIPLLGPIFQGISSIIGNFTSLKAVQLQTAAQTTIAETNASVQIIQATNDDIGLRIMRDAICLPVALWCMAMGWDTIISGRDKAGNLYHAWAADWIWHTPDFPASVGYIPYAVIVFLFGNIGLNMWNRK